MKAGSQKFSTLIVARSGVSCLVSSRMLVQFIIGPSSSKHLCMPVMEGARSRLGNIRKRARICIVLFCYLHFSGCSVLGGWIKNKLLLLEREIKSEEMRGCVGTLHLPELGERVLFRNSFLHPPLCFSPIRILSSVLLANLGKWWKFIRFCVSKCEAQ